MEIKIFCNNCKVEILRADTDTLKTPLVGEMFKVKKDMEWALFSDHDTGNDLICPMCDWVLHENGKIRVAVGNEFIIGIPELIIPGILAGFDGVPVAAPSKKPVLDIEESVVTAILEPTCYKTKDGKHLEGDLLNHSIHINGTFAREFRKLDKAAETSDDKMDIQARNALDREFKYVGIILKKLSPVDANNLSDCLDWSLKGRLSDYFPAWKDKLKKEVTPNPALEAIQKQVEGEKTEEKAEIAPELADIQSIVEGKPGKDGDAKEKPDVHQGAWTESQDADENSEINGDPPPGTNVAESGVTKPKRSRKIKKRGGKKKIK